MNFNEFQEVMKEQIKDFLPAEYRDAAVMIRENPKINETYIGMTVKKEEQLVAPTVNLDAFFKQYKAGKGMNTILQEAAQVIQTEAPTLDAAKLSDYEAMKEHLFLRVCSVERNEEFLSQVPHTRMADLAVTYNLVIIADKNLDGMASAVINNEMMKNFGITKEQLHADTVENAVRMFPVKAESMDDILTTLMPGEDSPKHTERPDIDGLEDMLESCNPQDGMTVITNKLNLHGASAIFYPEVMDQIGQAMEGDYFILPSSTHEVILLPDNGNFFWKDLEDLVKSVNDTQVMPVDKLSDHTYHYDVLDRVFEKTADFKERVEQMDQEQRQDRVEHMEEFQADAKEQRLIREQVKEEKRINAAMNDLSDRHGVEKTEVKSLLKNLNEKVAESKAMAVPAKTGHRQTHEAAL